MKLVFVITTHTEKWFDIANAWEEIGAPGVSILDSHGLHHVNTKKVEIGPMSAFSISGILRQLDTNSRILFSVAPDNLVDQLISSADEIINFDAPDTGIAFVVDVEQAFGLRRITDDK